MYIIVATISIIVKTIINIVFAPLISYIVEFQIRFQAMICLDKLFLIAKNYLRHNLK